MSPDGDVGPPETVEVELNPLCVLQLEYVGLSALAGDGFDPERRVDLGCFGVSTRWISAPWPRNAVFAVPPPPAIA